jgi:PTH2 family peptidyl-tRNA hydrolase
MSTKQVILVRSDLKMRRGKEYAQFGHASSGWMTDFMSNFTTHGRMAHFFESLRGAPPLSREQYDWLTTGTTKIVLKCTSEAELLRVYTAAIDQGLTAILVKDEGRTEVAPGTYTALAIGPHDVDKFVGLTDGFDPY